MRELSNFTWLVNRVFISIFLFIILLQFLTISLGLFERGASGS